MSMNMYKLICSFKSDLPNEIDFAMQVATLLANTDNFIWSKDYALVDAICSSLHVFTCVCKEELSTPQCDCYPRFWHKILTRQHSNQYLQAATTPPDTEQSYLNFTSLNDHLLEDHNKIFKRIRSAAEVVKQFSMTCDIKLNVDTTNEIDPNNYFYQNTTKKKKPKASPSLLKFVSLLLFCDETPLNLIGLDILSNTASKLSKIPDSHCDFTCLKLIQMFQEHCIDNIGCPDGDIYIIIRSIEVISRLISSSSPRVNSSVETLIQERDILLRLEQLLTSRNDVNLFLAALECFYRISRHQHHLIANDRAQQLIKILVNLLNCEDKQFFTSNALKRIELVGNDEQESWSTPSPVVESKSFTQISRPATTVAKTAATTIQPKLPPQQTPVSTQLPPSKEYTCEWMNCGTKFPDSKKVITHVFEEHIRSLSHNELYSCHWTSSTGTGPGCLTKRPKFSLLTHLNDYHCNATALERALTRSDPVKPPEHPGYGPNAALMALKRHANIEKSGSRIMNNSPLSVSVRLTAALILRNLATQSVEMKQALDYHEPLLSEICMTNGRDESKIIAECLSLFSSD